MTIEIKDLVFGYSENKTVLNGINLVIDSDNTIAIVGPSGCGKSTLLRLISALLPNNKLNSQSGSIKIDGKSPVEYSKLSKTGFMFQDSSLSLFPNLSVRENIFTPLKILRKNNYEEVDKLIQMLELEDVQSKLPSKLSGGQRTRVALARTFVTNPNLLLLDEPFSSLDENRKFILYNELERLRENYQPLVIIVTHEIREALLLSNHIFVFNPSGKVEAEIQVDNDLPRGQDFKLINEVKVEYEYIQEMIMAMNTKEATGGN